MLENDNRQADATAVIVLFNSRYVIIILSPLSKLWLTKSARIRRFFLIYASTIYICL